MAWDEVARIAAPSLPGCPELLLEQTAVQAAQRFLSATASWVQDFPVQAAAGELTVDVLAPAGSRIDRTLWLRPQGESGLGVKQPPHEFRPTEQRLVFERGADASRAWVLGAVLVPQEQAGVEASVPQGLMQRHAWAWASGVVAWLATHPDKTYSAPDVAQWHAQQFAQAIAKEMARVAAGHSGQALRTRAHFF